MENLEARAAAVHKLVGCAGCVDPEMLELSADPLPASDESALRLGPNDLAGVDEQHGGAGSWGKQGKVGPESPEVPALTGRDVSTHGKTR
jgi:hypothetical protein